MNEIINVPMSEQRSLATVTAEIRSYQDAARKMMITYCIEVGRRLVEAKGLVGHGEWGAYLRDELGFSQSRANDLMRLFDAYAADQIRLDGTALKSQAFGNLSYTQALALLVLPSDEEREAFVQSHDMSKMSTRELQEELRRRNQEPQDEPTREELAERLDDALEEIRGNGVALQDAEQKAAAFRVQAEGLEKIAAEHRAAEKAALREKEEAAAARAEAERRAKEAADKLAALQAELDKARKAEAAALKDLRKAQSDKTVPPDVLEKLKKEAEAAAEASYKADSEALDKAKKERARAEEELDKARREAEAAAKSLAALQRELALAAPELAVFRSRFERVQADLSELVQSVATLPEDKQAGARRGLAALLDGMKGQLDQIGGDRRA